MKKQKPEKIVKEMVFARLHPHDIEALESASFLMGNMSRSSLIRKILLEWLNNNYVRK